MVAGHARAQLALLELAARRADRPRRSTSSTKTCGASRARPLTGWRAAWMSAIEAPSLWPTSSGSGASSWASSAGSTSSASSWKNAGVRGAARRVRAAVAEAREGDHAPAGRLAQGLREVAPQPDRAEPLVQEHEARGARGRRAGRRPRRGARRPWPWRQPSKRAAVRSATRCATCEHAARDRRRALDPARGRARDDRDRALPELAARRARPRPRGLRRAVALVGRRPRGLLGRRSGTSSACARTRRTSACSARARCPAPSGSRARA